VQLTGSPRGVRYSSRQQFAQPGEILDRIRDIVGEGSFTLAIRR